MLSEPMRLPVTSLILLQVHPIYCNVNGTIITSATNSSSSSGFGDHLHTATTSTCTIYTTHSSCYSHFGLYYSLTLTAFYTLIDGS